MRKISPTTLSSSSSSIRGAQYFRQGFTIVELLIVIVVIAILATIAVVGYNGVQTKASEVSLKSDLTNSVAELEHFRQRNTNYPTSIDDLQGGLPTSQGNSLSYESANGAYCVTGNSNRAGVPVFHISSSGTDIREGPCPDAAVALTCPDGFIVVPGDSRFSTSDFCVMKYEAKNVNSTAQSQPAGQPLVSITQAQAEEASETTCDGCHLITDAEWMTIAANVLSVPSNWGGGVVGQNYFYAGNSDGSPGSALAATSDDSNGYYLTGSSSGDQRRTLTLTNGEIIWDLSGNVWEWTSARIPGGQQPGIMSQYNYTWKRWNASELQLNGLPVSSSPEFLYATATGWTTDSGVGALFSNSYESGERGHRRGGGWNTDAYAGVLALDLNYAPSSGYAGIGFRVAR